jgi:hypothetical protein
LLDDYWSQDWDLRGLQVFLGGLAEAQEGNGSDLHRAELVRGRPIWLLPGEVLDTFSADSHGGQYGSPLDERFGRPQLRFLDPASAALPGPVEIFYAPALGVTKHDLLDVLDGGDRSIREQQPFDGFLACWRCALFTGEHHVDLFWEILLGPLVSKIERHPAGLDGHFRYARCPLGGSRNPQLVVRNHRLLRQQVTKVCLPPILQDHASIVISTNREPVTFLVGVLENRPGIAFAVELKPKFRSRGMLAHHLPRLLHGIQPALDLLLLGSPQVSMLSLYPLRQRCSPFPPRLRGKPQRHPFR